MIRILLVDDQNVMRQGLKALLEPKQNLKVVGMAQDCSNVLNQVEILNPDVIVMDIEMPEVNGIIATQKICQQFPKTKILILSSHEELEYVIQALQAGAKGYMLKSSSAEDIEQAILWVHQGYFHLESELFKKVLAHYSHLQSTGSIEQNKSNFESRININNISNINNGYLSEIGKSIEITQKKSISTTSSTIPNPALEKSEGKIRNTSNPNRKIFKRKDSQSQEASEKSLLKDEFFRQNPKKTPHHIFFEFPILWIGCIVLLGIGSITTFYLWRNYWPSKSEQVLQAINSKTVLVKSQDLSVQIQANGTVKASHTTKISPEKAGRIEELYIKEGEHVTSGQVVAQMSNKELQAQVNQYKASVKEAKANLSKVQKGNRLEAIAAAKERVTLAQANVTLAKVELKRAQEEKQRNQLLANQGAISHNAFEGFVTNEAQAKANLQAELARLHEQKNNLSQTEQGSRAEEIVQARAQLERAQAELAVNQIQLNKTLIRAPFAGIITRRYAEAGDFVDSTTAASETEGATSTSIAELSSGLEIEAKIPEASIAQIKLEQKVDIIVDAYPNQNFTGTVHLISPRAVKENNVTSFRVKIIPTTGRAKLQLGMNARLVFFGEPSKNIMTVPLAAVVTHPDGRTGVYVAGQEAKGKFKLVELGIVSGNRVQVKNGLKQGDRVLLSPPEDFIIEGVDTTER